MVVMAVMMTLCTGGLAGQGLQVRGEGRSGICHGGS